MLLLDSFARECFGISTELEKTALSNHSHAVKYWIVALTKDKANTSINMNGNEPVSTNVDRGASFVSS